MCVSRPAATLLLVACGALLLAEGAAPPQTPIFRSRVDVIEIDMRVLDAQGQSITDLGRDEVEVLEDGVVQPVVAFSRVTVPARDPAAPRASPPARDVVTNRARAIGRIFVLFLDDLHVDNRNAHLVKSAARTFIDGHLGPADLASIVYASGRADAAQDFTDNRALLDAAIDKFIGRKLRPVTIERMDQYNQLYRGRGRPVFEDLRDPQDGERAFNARSAFSAIEAVSGVLARTTGRRKAMIVFSEGIDYDLSGMRSRNRVPDPNTAAGVLAPTAPTGGGETQTVGRMEIANQSNAVLFSLQSAVGAAARANLALYTIDPRRGDVTDVVQDLGAQVEDGSLGLTGQNVAHEMRDAQETLWMLAGSTGGFATLAASDYDGVFSRIVRESSDYYLVAYSPTNTARDGTYRDLTVRTSRPGATVQARREYYAPRVATKRVSRFEAPGVSVETSSLVMAPLPSEGLGIDLQAVALRHDRKKADVIVTLHFDGRELAPGEGPVSNTVEMALLAVDSAGTVHGATGTALPLSFEGDDGRVLREGGYRAISRLRLPPGRYQVRAAARERNSGRRGSVFVDLEVPDYGGRLAMSGLMLTSDATERVATAIDAATNERLPVLPVLRRSFAATDELGVVAELYAAGRDAEVTLTTSLLDRSGRERFRAVSQVVRADFRTLKGAYVHAVSIPLRDLAGDYTVQVEARPTDGRGDPVRRRADIQVAPVDATQDQP